MTSGPHCIWQLEEAVLMTLVSYLSAPFSLLVVSVAWLCANFDETKMRYSLAMSRIHIVRDLPYRETSATSFSKWISQVFQLWLSHFYCWKSKRIMATPDFCGNVTKSSFSNATRGVCSLKRHCTGQLRGIAFVLRRLKSFLFKDE